MMIPHRYSAMMINIFVSMVYGFGVPILFPIALFNMCIMYVQDRLLTVYFYKQPPLFD